MCFVKRIWHVGTGASNIAMEAQAPCPNSACCRWQFRHLRNGLVHLQLNGHATVRGAMISRASKCGRLLGDSGLRVGDKARQVCQTASASQRKGAGMEHPVSIRFPLDAVDAASWQAGRRAGGQPQQFAESCMSAPSCFWRTTHRWPGSSGSSATPPLATGDKQRCYRYRAVAASRLAAPIPAPVCLRASV